MTMPLTPETIKFRLQDTKKYQRLSFGIIAQVVDHVATHYTNPHEIDRKTRNIIQQIWGSAYHRPVNFRKAYRQLCQACASNQITNTTIDSILSAHSSAKARLPILTDFYERIFDHTGFPSSIIDHACGINPLAIPRMRLPPGTIYNACDIDRLSLDFLSKALRLIAPDIKFTTHQIPIADSVKKEAQLALFLKCITCLEHLGHGLGLTALEAQKAKHIVVSFAVNSPKKSADLVGKTSTHQFEEYLNTKTWHVNTLNFPGEKVYILTKS